VIEIESLSKSYGEFEAVSNLDLEIERGDIYGFIGPNGAGKTTTMRIAATLDLPDGGDVFVNGVSVLDDPRGVRRHLGFMPDAYGAYSATIVSEYLDFYGRAYGLRGRERTRRLAEVTEFTGLAPLLGKETEGLSKGMKQRLCLAKTLLHDPQLLILDEPAAGLDPRARVELRELVSQLAVLGKAVLISSHILAELSELCTGVAVIEAGKIRATGSVGDIMRELSPHTRVFLRCVAGPEAARVALAEIAGIESVRPDGEGVSFQVDGGEDTLARVLAELVRRGLAPTEYAPERANLEDLFLSLTEGVLQ
jgi:ABC-2 type transport system ATP-binding protein